MDQQAGTSSTSIPSQEVTENQKNEKKERNFFLKKSPSKMKLWDKLKSIRRRRGVPSEISLQPTASEIIEIIESSERSHPFFTYSIDEAFICAVDNVLALIHTLKGSQ